MKNIKILREERDMSIYKLSKLTGISQDTLKNIEARKQSPTLHTLTCLAKGLNVSLDFLLED